MAGYPALPTAGTPGPTRRQAQLEAQGRYRETDSPPPPPSPQHVEDQYVPNLVTFPKDDQIEPEASRYPAASLSGNLFAHEDTGRELAHHLVPNAFLCPSQYVRPETDVEGRQVWVSEGNHQGPGKQDIPAFTSLWQDLKHKNPNMDQAILALVSEREHGLLATLPFRSLARVLPEAQVDLCQPLFQDPNDPLTISVGLLKGNLAYRLGKRQATTLILGLGTSLCDPTKGYPSKHSAECICTLVANNYLHLLRTILIDVVPDDLGLINIILLGPVPVGKLDVVRNTKPLTKGIFQRIFRSPGDANILKRVYPVLTGHLVDQLLLRADLEEFPLQYRESSHLYTAVAAYCPEFLEMLNKHVYYRILLFAVGRRATSEDAWSKILSDPAELRRSSPFKSTQLTEVNFDHTPQALGITSRRKPRKEAYTVSMDDVATHPHLQHHNYVLNLRAPTPCPGYGIFRYDALLLRMAATLPKPQPNTLPAEDKSPKTNPKPDTIEQQQKKGPEQAGPPMPPAGHRGPPDPPIQPSMSSSEPGGSPAPSVSGHSTASAHNRNSGTHSPLPTHRGSYRGRRPWGQRPPRGRGRYDAAPRESRGGHRYPNQRGQRQRGRNTDRSDTQVPLPLYEQDPGTSHQQQPQQPPPNTPSPSYRANPTAPPARPTQPKAPALTSAQHQLLSLLQILGNNNGSQDANQAPGYYTN